MFNGVKYFFYIKFLSILSFTALFSTWIHAEINSYWVNSEDLKPGMKILTHDNKALVVDNVWKPRKTKTTTYNFSVADNHTYFITVNLIWSHNVCYSFKPNNFKELELKFQNNVSVFPDQYNGGYQIAVAEDIGIHDFQILMQDIYAISKAKGGQEVTIQISQKLDKYYFAFVQGKVNNIPEVLQTLNVNSTNTVVTYRVSAMSDGKKIRILWSNDGGSSSGGGAAGTLNN